jgi:hypothetical protein
VVFRQICEKRILQRGEAPERSVDVEIAIQLKKKTKRLK